MSSSVASAKYELVKYELSLLRLTISPTLRVRRTAISLELLPPLEDCLKAEDCNAGG